MRNIWIVIADAGRARILSKFEGVADLTMVREIDNPGGRAHNVHRVTDQRGRCVSHSGAVSAMETPTPPHEHQVREFAQELNHLLDDAASRGAYDRLAVVAPPHFLGLLRSGMKSAAKQRLALSLPGDLTRHSLAEVQSHLGEALKFSHADASAR
jgi:protein required for attachment to host cells